MYLKSEIINSRNDSCKFWSLINSLMPERIKSASPKYLNVNNSIIGDATEIAEYFNKYFCDIGKALTDKVDSVDSYDYRSFHRILYRLLCSFALTLIMKFFSWLTSFLMFYKRFAEFVQCTPRLFADDTCLLISKSKLENLQIELNKDITFV